MLEEIILYMRGYRTCYDCGDKAPKQEMNYVKVRDGIMDSKYVWNHVKCTPNPRWHIPLGESGPFG